MENPTDRASITAFLHSSKFDVDELGLTLIKHLVLHKDWIEGNDLLRQEPLRYIEEMDYFNEILGFTKHLVSYQVLRANGLIM